MLVEIRVEIRSRKWKEILSAWAQEERETSLSGALGSVVGLFQEGSEEYTTFLCFLDEMERLYPIRVDKRRRAIYSREEKEAADLLLVFPQTVFDAVDLKANYETDETCAHCQRTLPPIRVGPLRLDEARIGDSQFFTTEADDLVVGTALRRSLEASRATGVAFDACLTSSGQVSDRFHELVVESKIGHRLDEAFQIKICLCGRWIRPTSGPLFPIEHCFERGSWDGSDFALTSDLPSGLVASPAIVAELEACAGTTGWDQTIPLCLVDKSAPDRQSGA